MANNQIVVKWHIQLLCILAMLLSALTVTGFAQTSGKISGTVTDAATAEAFGGIKYYS